MRPQPLALSLLTSVAYASWDCPNGQPGDCNTGTWGRIHYLEGLIEQDLRLSQTIATLETFQGNLEKALPELLVSVRDYLTVTDASLDPVIADMTFRMSLSTSEKTRGALNIMLDIILELKVQQAKMSSKESLNQLIYTAVHGSDAERAEALKHFQPITQNVLLLATSLDPGRDDSAPGTVAAVKKGIQEIAHWSSLKFNESSSQINELRPRTAELARVATDRKKQTDTAFQSCKNIENRRVAIPGKMGAWAAEKDGLKSWLDHEGCLRQYCTLRHRDPPSAGGGRGLGG